LVDNTDYKASLIPGKVYRLIPDARAAKDDFVRIVDESGEDYLYHKSHFVFVDFPASVKRQILAIERAGKQAVAADRRNGIAATPRVLRFIMHARRASNGSVRPPNCGVRRR
jgi:hypothetical protein